MSVLCPAATRALNPLRIFGNIVFSFVQAENDFLLHNLLFTGFFGETYTGMTKDSPAAEWMWPAESVRATMRRW